MSVAVPKFVHEEALAYELAAHFYLELGETDKSVEYFLLAHERYQDWVRCKAGLFHACFKSASNYFRLFLC